MGQIIIESTPRIQSPAAIFDPASDPRIASGPERFSKLRFVGTPQSGNVGGRFALPTEFDTTQFAAHFAPEGNGVLAMATEQPVIGTGYTSEGWQPWKYPDKGAPLLDDEGRQKVQRVPNPSWTKESKDDVPKEIEVPLFAKHPLGGKIHTVPSMDPNGVTYVLLCRPLIVQQQVNELYGLLSIDNMTAEVYGETINGRPRDDTGMLGEQQLRAVRNIDADINADRAAEENLGRSTVVHSTLQTNQPSRLTKPPTRVSR